MTFNERLNKLKAAFDRDLERLKQDPERAENAKHLTEQIYAKHGVVVKYRIAELNPLRAILNMATVEEKLDEIFTSNPNADLKQFASALGIEVLEQSKKGQAGGIYIGE